MSASPDIVADPAGPSEDRARLDRQLARLDRLSDLGLDIAEALAAQAKGEGRQVVEGDLALAYDRVARAVRMAVMLQARLAAEAQGEARPAGPSPVDPERARKDQIARVVGRVAERDERLDGHQVSGVVTLARERLEHDDIYGPVMTLPISQVVDEICRDLGLTPEWWRLAREAWAVDEINGGDMGDALQAWLAEDPDAEDDPEDGSEDGSDDPAPPPRIETFQERLRSLAHQAERVVAGRRDSG